MGGTSGWLWSCSRSHEAGASRPSRTAPPNGARLGITGAKASIERHFHPHFHLLLGVPAEYFDSAVPLLRHQVEWWTIWEQSLCAKSRRVFAIRVTEDKGEVAKSLNQTKPTAYPRLDDDRFRSA
jgi:hypothetical protein